MYLEGLREFLWLVRWLVQKNYFRISSVKENLGNIPLMCGCICSFSPPPNSSIIHRKLKSKIVLQNTARIYSFKL